MKVEEALRKNKEFPLAHCAENGCRMRLVQSGSGPTKGMVLVGGTECRSQPEWLPRDLILALLNQFYKHTEQRFD